LCETVVKAFRQASPPPILLHLAANGRSIWVLELEPVWRPAHR
jgi:hypothetical protein